MKKLSLLFVLLTMFGTAASAQVTYMETNHFLLNFFTSTGYASYDWRFEPLKTDLERGQLKGDVKRVITTIVDKTGRGFGEHFSDTTLYNKKGNIVKVTAPKVDEFNPRNKFVPDSWTYQYDDSGKPISTTQHLYGIPLDNFYGFMSRMALDNRNMYAVITVNNMNDENVIPFFNALLDAGRGEKEAWMTE